MTIPVQTPAGLEAAFDLSAYYPALIFVAVIVGMAVAIIGSSHMPFLEAEPADDGSSR